MQSMPGASLLARGFVLAVGHHWLPPPTHQAQPAIIHVCLKPAAARKKTERSVAPVRPTRGFSRITGVLLAS